MKFKLTQETLEYKGRILYRIEALKDFRTVRKGDKGGFVESEANLSQDSDCWIGGNAKIYGNAKVYHYAKVCGDAKVYGNACAYGKANIEGNADIGGNSKVGRMCDYIVFKNWWSSGRYFTWTRSNNMWSVGCFYGTGEELIKRAYADSELSGREYERIVKYVEEILKQ